MRIKFAGTTNPIDVDFVIWTGFLPQLAKISRRLFTKSQRRLLKVEPTLKLVNGWFLIVFVIQSSETYTVTTAMLDVDDAVLVFTRTLRSATR